MKKSRIFALAIISIIILQLFVSVSPINGDLTTASALNVNDSQTQHPITHSNYKLPDFFGSNCLFTRVLNLFCSIFDEHPIAPNVCVAPITHMTISPKTATIEAGQSQEYSITAYNDYGTSWDLSSSPGIDWSIDSGTGTYVWTGNSVQVTQTGTWVVTATIFEMSDTATLVVVGSENPETLDYITASVDPTTVEAPNAVTGTATAYDLYGNSWDISTIAAWSITEGNDGGTWLQNIYTPNTAGVYTVQATYGGKSTSASLTVTHATDEAHLDYITASVDPTAVAAPTTVTGTATAFDTFGNSWDISAVATWSIPAGNDGGSWQQNVYTSSKAGTYTVEASYEGKTANADLTVTHASDDSYLDHIVASISPTTVTAPDQATGEATAYDQFGNSWDISTLATWSIPAGSDGGVWSQNVYTSKNAGTYTVEASYNGKTATATLTVNHAADVEHLDHITASLNQTTVAAPNDVAGTAIAYDIFGNSWDISSLAEWSIPSGGDGGSWTGNIYTSHTAGTYTIQATYNGKTATVDLAVIHAVDDAYLDHIVIAPKYSTVDQGVAQHYTATAFDTSGNSWAVDAVYSCQNSNVLISGDSARSNVAGSYTITGTYSGKSDTATLKVNGQTPTTTPTTITHGAITSITVSPKSTTIIAGASQTFEAVASDGHQTWIVTGQVTWSIDVAAGGSWSQGAGKYTSANAGTWTVRATLNTVVGTASLTVNADSAAVDHIVISPKTATVRVGETQSFTTTAYDQFGNSLGDVTSFTTFEFVGASMEGNTVKATNVGSYNVVATYNGMTDTAVLTVTEQATNLSLILETVIISLIALLIALTVFRFYSSRRKRQLNLSEPANDVAQASGNPWKALKKLFG
ncbi:MAG: hypothetical protein ACQCN6_01960 [Candidatus Bathyarchaeia archaeon]